MNGLFYRMSIPPREKEREGGSGREKTSGCGTALEQMDVLVRRCRSIVSEHGRERGKQQRGLPWFGESSTIYIGTVAAGPSTPQARVYEMSQSIHEMIGTAVKTAHKEGDVAGLYLT